MIHLKKHPGILLKTVGEKRAARDENQFQGFFAGADLRDLLQEDNCAGIRFYNVDGKTTEERRMIAIGVTPDGDELNQPLTSRKYCLSVLTDPAGQPSQKMNRSEAKAAVEASEKAKEVRESILFASFFSKTMIENLLKSPKNGRSIDGIRFYIMPQFKGAPGTVTHCGVSAVLDNGKIAVAQRARHIVSDQPCPGFCAVEIPAKKTEPAAASRTALPAGAAPFPEKDSVKYLVIW